MNNSIEELHQALMRLLDTGSNSPPPGSSDATTPDSAQSVTVAQPPAVPSQIVDFKNRGYHLDVTVAPDQVIPTAQYLSDQGFSIDTVTGVDWIAEDQMEVVYDYFHPSSPARVAVRTRVPRAQPELPTISTVFPGANWHERETHDFFGIRFLGHPDLSPLLLPDDADYHPLRKDYPGAA